MNSIETLTTFFGWTSVINIVMLMFALIFLTLMRSSIATIHSKLSGLSEADLSRAYFQFLAQYKTAIIVFNFVPYLALKIMA